MTLLIVKIVVAVIIVGASTYLSEWLKNNWLHTWDKIWVIVIAAVIATIAIIFVDFVSDGLGKSLGKTVVTVKTSKEKNEIDIIIKIKRSVDRISLNYPILGTITNFQDLNSLTKARTVLAKVVGGTTQNDVQNNLQMTITDIKPDAVLQYKIFYNPTSENIEIAGTDRYELVYTWEYRGEEIQETQWMMTKDDSITTKPNIEIMGTRIFNRALTPEEIKKTYEAGPPQTKF